MAQHAPQANSGKLAAAPHDGGHECVDWRRLPTAFLRKVLTAEPPRSLMGKPARMPFRDNEQGDSASPAAPRLLADTCGVLGWWCGRAGSPTPCHLACCVRQPGRASQWGALPYLNAAQAEHPALGEEHRAASAPRGSRCCSVAKYCRCIGLARASATNFPGTSPSPPSETLRNRYEKPGQIQRLSYMLCWRFM